MHVHILVYTYIHICIYIYIYMYVYTYIGHKMTGHKMTRADSANSKDHYSYVYIYIHAHPFKLFKSLPSEQRAQLTSIKCLLTMLSRFLQNDGFESHVLMECLLGDSPLVN